MRTSQRIGFWMIVVSFLLSVTFVFAADSKSKINPEKISFAQNGKSAKALKNLKEVEKMGKVPSSVALSQKDKAATIRRVRKLAGVAKKNLPAAPPANITLSPDKLTEGQSWLGMFKGAIRPHKNEQNMSYMTIGPKEGVFLLHFEPMAKGSPYLLDCKVSAYPEGEMIWAVRGAFNGAVEEQQGHLLIGFIATSKVSTLSISRHQGVVLGHLFGCELTRVDE